MADETSTRPARRRHLRPPRDAASSSSSSTPAQGIARITLNRPPANVLSVDDDGGAQHRPGVARVPARRQAGRAHPPPASTSRPASSWRDHLGDRAYMMLEDFRRIFENLAKLDKPTLAVVAGPALGRRLHAGRRLRHGAGRRQRQVRPPGDQGRRLQHRGGGAAAAPHRAQEGVRDDAGRREPHARPRPERIGLITRVVPDDTPGGGGGRAHPALPGGERARAAVHPAGASPAACDLLLRTPCATPRTST